MINNADSIPGAGMPMPPLVWRERVVLCPNCWQKVSLEDDLCPNCGGKFEQHPEIREKRREMKAKVRRDIGSALALIAVTFSSSILITSLLLNKLHQWVQPINRDPLPYIAVMIFGAIGAAFVYRLDVRAKSNGRRLTQLQRIAPQVLLSISVIGIMLFLFADQVDSFLTSASTIIALVMLGTMLLGIAALAKASRTERRKRERMLG